MKACYWQRQKGQLEQPGLVVSIFSASVWFITDRSAAGYQDRQGKYLLLMKTNEFCVFCTIEIFLL